MNFSSHYRVTLTKQDDWFDPFLAIDTKLFIDPFLIYARPLGAFSGTHQEIISFFNDVFKLVAATRGNKHDARWRKAVDLLLFPEVDELCLGFTSRGTHGAGSGRILGSMMADALWEAVEAGVREFSHFEEIRILREGIGADRISDMTASVIRRKLIAYTSQVCKRHGIPTSQYNYQRGSYDHSLKHWVPVEAELPRNPESGGHILLVPRRFLRSLTTIDPDDFWRYCIHNANESLRNDFGADISSRVDIKTIVGFARKHPELRSQYVKALEKNPPSPYSFAVDPSGLISWYSPVRDYCLANALFLKVSSQTEFERSIELILREFKKFIEQNGGWKLLRNDDGSPRAESISQTIFYGIAKSYCKANNIEISRETDLGRGPVDFKVSQGYKLRALIEVKRASNSKFWDGLEKQLPAYMDVEDIERGHFLVVAETDRQMEKAASLDKRCRALSKKLRKRITATCIDTRDNKPSASKL